MRPSAFAARARSSARGGGNSSSQISTSKSGPTTARGSIDKVRETKRRALLVRAALTDVRAYRRRRRVTTALDPPRFLEYARRDGGSHGTDHHLTGIRTGRGNPAFAHLRRKRRLSRVALRRRSARREKPGPRRARPRRSGPIRPEDGLGALDSLQRSAGHAIASAGRAGRRPAGRYPPGTQRLEEDGLGRSVSAHRSPPLLLPPARAQRRPR